MPDVNKSDWQETILTVLKRLARLERDELAINEAFRISMKMVLRMNMAFEMKLDTEQESIQK
tara:strand:- start:1058 stop:1243 length:186 start_codon:yes stop_codon:yes gene_type:complete